MIIKTHKGECPYAQIDRSVLDDDRISYRAKGILAYLLSKPPNWWVRSDDVIKHGTEGRDAIRAAMNELRKFGYAKLVNTVAGREWHVFERPQKVESGGEVYWEQSSPDRSEVRLGVAKPGNPSLVPSPEKPTPENPLLSNKEDSKKEGYIKDPEPKSASPKRFIPPTLEQVESFMSEIGMNGSAKTEAGKFFDYHETGGWMMARGKKMVNWKAAIRTWKRNWEERSGAGARKTAIAPPAQGEPPEYQRFIQSHPRPAYREKFASWKAITVEHEHVKSEFRRWAKSGRYDNE